MTPEQEAIALVIAAAVDASMRGDRVASDQLMALAIELDDGTLSAGEAMTEGRVQS